MKKWFDKPVLFLGAALVLLCTACVVYFVSPDNSVKFVTYLSGVSSVGILVLTSFYVFYTNLQIKELQKQRMYQIQPLPIINIKNSYIVPPRITIDFPGGGTVCIRSDFIVEFELENIGNGPAVDVDVYFGFVGDRFSRNGESLFVKRVRFLKNEEKIIMTYTLKRDTIVALDLLCGLNTNSCLADRPPGLIIGYTVVYKNALGAYYKMSAAGPVYVSESDQMIVTEWVSAMKTFSNIFSRDLEEFNVTFKRDRNKALNDFNGIKRKLFSTYKIKPVTCVYRIYDDSCSFVPITNSAANAMLKSVHRSFPLSAGSGPRQISDNIKSMMSKYFSDFAAIDKEFLPDPKRD